MLSCLGLEELFEVVVAGEDVERGEPATDCYLRAAELLGLEPFDHLAAEDSAVCVVAAHAAGYRVLEIAL